MYAFSQSLGHKSRVFVDYQHRIARRDSGGRFFSQQDTQFHTVDTAGIARHVSGSCRIKSVAQLLSVVIYADMCGQPHGIVSAFRGI